MQEVDQIHSGSSNWVEEFTVRGSWVQEMSRLHKDPSCSGSSCVPLHHSGLNQSTCYQELLTAIAVVQVFVWNQQWELLERLLQLLYHQLDQNWSNTVSLPTHQIHHLAQIGTRGELRATIQHSSLHSNCKLELVVLRVQIELFAWSKVHSKTTGCQWSVRIHWMKYEYYEKRRFLKKTMRAMIAEASAQRCRSESSYSASDLKTSIQQRHFRPEESPHD